MVLSSHGGDHLTLDALFNVYGLRVWVTESAAGHECSLVAPRQGALRDIYLGHIGDWHYVSVTSSLVLLGSHIDYILHLDVFFVIGQADEDCINT